MFFLRPPYSDLVWHRVLLIEGQLERGDRVFERYTSGFDLPNPSYPQQSSRSLLHEPLLMLHISAQLLRQMTTVKARKKVGSPLDG